MRRGEQSLEFRAGWGAAKGDDMKTPDGIEQHRPRARRGDDGLRDLEG
jgi:hypothetical protein